MDQEPQDHRETTPPGEGEQPDGAGRLTDRAEEVAGHLGRFLGQSARRARALGEEAAREARPELERLARSARAAADAARPHVERAGRSAVREHDGELKRAARITGEVAAQRLMPAPLRPFVAAMEAEQWRRAPLRDARAEGAAPHTGAATPLNDSSPDDAPSEGSGEQQPR
ncbi:MAG: hypothetical protein O2888_01575 [Chloroflexi bacterium]|nr:hypothetical protein [Chloroflexota bacterium]